LQRYVKFGKQPNIFAIFCVYGSDYAVADTLFLFMTAKSRLSGIGYRVQRAGY